MHRSGRLVAGNDDDDHHFVFAICDRCTLRLDRLPVKLQRRQLQVAVANLARDPDRYLLWCFENEVQARLFCRMEADRLSESR